MTDPLPLVLLPGMNCTARLWTPVLAGLSDRGDRGGGSARPILHGEVRGRDLEDCLSHLLATLPERFALAGLSLGGIVAMALARVAPERIDRLCLLDTNARAPSTAQLESFDRQIARIEDGLTSRRAQEELLDVLVHPDHQSRLREEVLTMGEETGARRLAEQYAIQRTRGDERQGLTQRDVPVAVIAGAEDALCPPERHHEIVELVPGSRLSLIPGVGHLSTMEAPGSVGRAMRHWLAA
ncbi:MAG: alpha/beta fold hydrolase [Brachybacterium sp.]|nr:alpha/beta fold hydrolase [Brachybacterium sp.]